MEKTEEASMQKVTPKKPCRTLSRRMDQEAVSPTSYTGKIFLNFRLFRRRFTDTSVAKQTSQTARVPTSSWDYLENYILGPPLFESDKLSVHSGVRKGSALPVLIKMYAKGIGSTEIKTANSEFNLLKHMDHECIIKAIERINTPESVYTVFERFSETTLRDFLLMRGSLKLTECIALNIVKQVGSAVAYCHQHNVTHHAITLDTVLITDDFQIKVTGFEHATCFPAARKFRGPRKVSCYTAPEAAGADLFFGPPTDVWALGVLLYCLLCGHHPFSGSPADIKEFKFPRSLSQRSRSLLQKLLAWAPRDRLSASELVSY